MTLLPITLTIAAAAALLNIWLALRVSRLRLRDKVSIGHGGNAALEARMRAHANFAEFAPIFIILMALIELARGGGAILWLIGFGFILARIAHALGMDRPAPNPLRAGGIVLTMILTLGLTGWALAIPYLAKAAAQPVMFG